MSQPRFIIQKHDATRLHYDFRLEEEGVLKSWAVPKGFSTDPSEKRLAIEVEDHDPDALEFEGTIPKDEYGGGTVMIWDRGKYDHLTEGIHGRKIKLSTACQNGHIQVRLHGEKIKGKYALTRIRDGEEPQWLLVKMKDEEADARRNPVRTEPDSVVSGRSLEEIAKEDK
ncbi:MAG: DNA polymerase ligase N-terminal domain-containing protein [Kiritimatiellia bacterium]